MGRGSLNAVHVSVASGEYLEWLEPNGTRPCVITEAKKLAG